MPHHEVSYQILIAEHEQIDHWAARLLEETDRPVADLTQLSEVMEMTTRTLADHLEHEDSFIYTRMLHSDRSHAARDAAQFLTEFLTLRIDWQRYLEEWTLDAIEIGWEDFCEATRSIIGRLRERVRCENELLYPVALHNGFIRLRALAA